AAAHARLTNRSPRPLRHRWSAGRLATRILPRPLCDVVPPEPFGRIADGWMGGGPIVGRPHVTVAAQPVRKVNGSASANAREASLKRSQSPRSATTAATA